NIFCPNCDSVLAPLKEEKEAVNVLGCLDCDYRSDNDNELDNFVIKGQIDHSPKSKIEVVTKSAEDAGITAEIREELREQYREALGNAR
ncbi:MAG: hypothetical protein ACXAD7_13905, partial [Candidatus Kariarchaeaceae archaeon]